MSKPRQQRRAADRAARKASKLAGTRGVKTKNGSVVELRFEDLNERQQRGYALWKRAQSLNGMAVEFADDSTLWFSATDNTRAYMVVRASRNHRGEWVIEYRCLCEDYKKHGAVDCKHIFAEKLRRNEVVIIHPKSARKKPPVVAQRRPARDRKAHDGVTIRSSQRRARKAMPERIPQLIVSLKAAFDRTSRGIVIPMPEKRTGRIGAPLTTRALALVAKVARGESADAMMDEYARMIQDGTLLLKNPPCQNTLSLWMNDKTITPVLQEFLRLTTLPFREREIGAIIDSSKVSQLMTAHAKEVDYNNHDKRPTADWAKCHALVGVETLVVMAVEFSGSVGEGSGDINFVERLVEAASAIFPLSFFLGDKAYLKETTLDWLWNKGIKAVIPLKKGWFKDKTRVYREAVMELVEWYDRNENRDFHEIYRLRPKIEGLFSLLKRMADGYCWSRGRPRQDGNQSEPCTAWVNELLCKFIYLNLRTTVTLEHETGVVVDYLVPSRRFPAPDEPLLNKTG